MSSWSLLGILVLIISMHERSVASATDFTPGLTDNGERDLEKEAKNTKIIVKFYKKVFGDRDLTDLETFISPTYVHHNPLIPDGREGLIGYLKKTFPSGTPPFTRLFIERTVAEGDWVWIHTLGNLTPNGDPHSDLAIVEMYRIQNGLIVEHFEVTQPVPSWSANKHPMFSSLRKEYKEQIGFARS